MGLRSFKHRCVRRPVPNHLLKAANYELRWVGQHGVSGQSPESAFLLPAFSFSDKKKMPGLKPDERRYMFGHHLLTMSGRKQTRRKYPHFSDWFNQPENPILRRPFGTPLALPLGGTRLDAVSAASPPRFQKINPDERSIPSSGLRLIFL